MTAAVRERGGPVTQEPLSILHWMAPSLVRDGLLANEDWVPAHCARACKLYPNQGLHVAATLLAALHRNGVDYLEQAPVLALAITNGTAPRARRERQYIAMRVGPLFERGPKLRDLLSTFGLPLPIRKIAPFAVRPGLWRPIKELAHLNPSTLSQIIPEGGGAQSRWLERLHRWGGHLASRHALRPELFEWAATALSETVEADGLTNVADFFVANPARFNSRWDWAKAAHESELWHDQIEQISLTAKHGAAIDYEVDYGEFPIDIDVAGYRFVALRSGRALISEGRKMHHCVASYVADVLKGLSRIYSIQLDGKRVATAQIVSGKCVQLKGPCNRPVAQAVRDAVVSFLTRVDCVAV